MNDNEEVYIPPHPRWGEHPYGTEPGGFIVNVIKLMDMSKAISRGKPLSVSLYIREVLLVTGGDYVYSMWRQWRDINIVLGYHYCTYEIFRRYIYQLKKLLLIRHIRTVRSEKLRYSQHWYVVVEGNIDSPLWLNPNKRLGEKRKWKVKSWG